LDIRDCCRKNNVSESSYYKWKRRLGKEQGIDNARSEAKPIANHEFMLLFTALPRKSLKWYN